MPHLDKAMKNLKVGVSKWEQQPTISFLSFLEQVQENPKRLIRNIYQVYHDMVKSYTRPEPDEYQDDPESIQYIEYNCHPLFVENSDHPFFADRLFANRLIKHVEALKIEAQQNKIYIFEGPHGSGKSTFFNNLLKRFEEYANSEAGSRYEVVWRFKRNQISQPERQALARLLDQLCPNHSPQPVGLHPLGDAPSTDSEEKRREADWLEVPCPSHDNPLLLIPRRVRRQFIDDLLDDGKNKSFKWQLNSKEYEWIFQDEPCTICAAIYQALLRKCQTPEEALRHLHARHYTFNRRLGEGISVFTPGDKSLSHHVIKNNMIQQGLDSIFQDSNRIQYLYSRYAKTNNGIYGLMDIKSHNQERLLDLHNIISDGVHKVEDIEENVNSLLFGLMNPEDREVLKNLHSFADRIEYIHIPYILDLKTEVAIYRNVFGPGAETAFLPRVLHNFARVIIASRMHTQSTAMSEWIGEPKKYRQYCDENLMLLKIEIYTGYIPTWLSEEDRKRLDAKRRRKIIAESEQDGRQGLSGRDAIRLFNEFYSTYARREKLIDMSMLVIFFRQLCKKEPDIIPQKFLESLRRMYNYAILQEVKESLYYYNEEEISREIQDYLFAVNFEPGATVQVDETKEQLEITETFFERIEQRLLGQTSTSTRTRFRHQTQHQYTTTTLTLEMLRDGLDITETSLYKDLYNRYTHNLKENVLEPFIGHDNFRRAIKDFDEESFKTYDKKIQADVRFLIENLMKKYRYTRQGAKEICIYAIDHCLPELS